MLSPMRDVVRNEVNKYRTERNLTQEDLALAVEVSRQTIIAIEKGNYTPSVLLALKIARYFKKPVEDVFILSHAK
jgi:putative transcriptional regulator